jgi:hypothetical protein
VATAALILSIVAILLSAWSAWSSHRIATTDAARRREEVADRAAEVAAARRADLKLEVERAGADHRLHVSNSGRAAATDIAITFIAPVGRGQLPQIEESGRRIARLGPDEERAFGLSIGLNFAARWTCSVEWTDAEGRHDTELEIGV